MKVVTQDTVNLNEFLPKKDKLSQWEKKAQELYTLKELRKHCEKQEEILMEELKSLAKNKSKIGKIFSFILERRKGTINYKALVEIENIDPEPYRKEDIEFWKVTKL